MCHHVPIVDLCTDRFSRNFTSSFRQWGHQNIFVIFQINDQWGMGTLLSFNSGLWNNIINTFYWKKAGNFCITQNSGAFTKPVHVWVSSWVRVLVCVGVSVSARMRECACALLALLIQHTTCIRHIVCRLSGSTKFSYIFLWTARLAEKSYWS